MGTVLFYRDFRRFHGGHLKVWDYFNHVGSHPAHRAQIRFSTETVFDRSNPWRDDDRARAPEPTEPVDVLFLAGNDWLAYSTRELEQQPIINLIQHPRHADPRQRRFSFLERPAVRLCVSSFVAEALERTGRVNGPIFTMPTGIDLSELPAPRSWDERELDVVVLAIKQPELGTRVASRLRRSGRRIDLVDTLIPRSRLLDTFARSNVAVVIPNALEGFSLPPLEAMALGCLVVCSDCGGNRSYCRPDENCLMPPMDEESLVAAAERALELGAADRDHLVDRATAIAGEHDLPRERSAFLALLDRVDKLL